MGFNIVLNDNLTLNDLLEINEQNGSIIRSSHIGNWNKSTMALSRLGFHIVMHEFLHGNSNMYEPAFFKTENEKVQISEKSAALQLYDNTFHYNELGYYKPSKFHYDNLMRIFENVEPISVYFLENEYVSNQIIDCLLKKYPENFNKYIDSDGNVYTLSKCDDEFNYYSFGQNTIKISREQVKESFYKLLSDTSNCLKENTSNNPSGVLPNTKIYLMLTCVVELLTKNVDSNVAELYHFSGLQMINYLIKNDESANEYNTYLNEAYDLIREKLPYLPESVNFNLIPTEFLKYTSCKSSLNTGKLDEIFDMFARIKGIKEEKKKFIKEEILKVEETLSSKGLDELVQIINSLRDKIAIRRIKKLLILVKEGKQKELIDELANVILITSDQNLKIESYEKSVEESENSLELLINSNKELFNDSTTQNDLLLDGDGIYITSKCLDIKIKELLKMGSYINGVSAKKTKKGNKTYKLIA